MTEKKNWWVTAYDGKGNVVEEWILEDRTEHDAAKEAEAAVGALSHFEIEPDVYVEDWTIREAVVTIEVEGGVVTDVIGLPTGWTYELLDHDVKEEATGPDDESVYWVDTPDPSRGDGEWCNIETFSSREEAIRFVRNNYGGDDVGRVSLITEGTRVEEE